MTSNREDNRKPDFDSGIEQVEKSLYSPGSEEARHFPSPLTSQESETKQSWKHDEEKNSGSSDESNMKNDSLLNKLLVGSLIFLLLALGYAFLSVGLRNQSISGDNIILEVDLPQAVRSAETLDLTVEVANRNRVDLEGVVLVFDFPIGTRSAQGGEEEVRTVRVPIGTLSSGEQHEESLSVRLYGDEGETKAIDMNLEYQVPGSSSVFFTSAREEVTITNSAVILNIDAPDEVSRGQDISFTVDVVANAESPVGDVVLEMDYPFGFTFRGSSPNPASGNSVWRLGDIPKGETETIRVSGVMDGEQGQEQVIKVATGIGNTEQTSVVTPYATQDIEITIAEALLDLDMSLGRSRASLIEVSPNQDVDGSLTISNGLSSDLADIEVEVEFSGSIPVEDVQPGSGLYSGGSIIWNQRTLDELSLLAPGDNTTVTFTFRPQLPRGISQSPELLVDARVKGEGVAEPVEREIETSISKRVVLSSQPTLTANISGGIFGESGPRPPQAGEATTYTVSVAASDFLKAYEDLEVSLRLPANVSFLDANPSEGIEYNPRTGLVSWRIDEVSPGDAPHNRLLHLEITPAESQLGSRALLLSDLTLEARDPVLEKSISVLADELSTPDQVED